MSNHVLNEMIRFQTDRLLDKQDFNIEVATKNILEELMEAHGIVDTSKEKKNERKEVLYRALVSIVNEVKMFERENFVEPTEEMIVDAFCDICEFAIGEPLKLGYDPIICLDEMQKEINSREGHIINGKFEKDRTKSAMKKWYYASYEKAKVVGS